MTNILNEVRGKGVSSVSGEKTLEQNDIEKCGTTLKNAP